jgi:hypothetical protein
MTAPGHRGRRSPLTAAWWGSALTAALALIGLVIISGAPGVPRQALRADTYNQMTGIGQTSSAVSVSWKGGLLDSTNQPLTSTTLTGGGTELNPNSDRAAGTGPLSFMDSDFQNLQVTVSQTQNITHQGITVQWTTDTADASVGAPLLDFMQMMECYGDATTGPSPEGCEYGSQFMLGTIPNLWVTNRIGYICSPGQTASTTAPATGADGIPSEGCDVNEQKGTYTPDHCDPSAAGNATCTAGQFSIPFVPADGTANPIYGQTNLTSEFNQFNSNEVQAAYTDSTGKGQRQFETLTANQSQGLGCGETETNGQTRNCWLVIVPRGNYEPNGYKVRTQIPLNTSPLSASNWAQRIQIHLTYAPLNPGCPTSVVANAMAGTQVAFRAVTSWQTGLNAAANCSTVYSYTASTETETTNDIVSGLDGLAFTTIPVGGEATRDGLTPPTLPTMLYAPVAVTAVDFGFNVNQGSQLTTPVNLTPSLLARALTQVYTSDLPDYYPDLNLPGPTWAQKNPLNMTADSAFHTLNSGISVYESSHPMFPLITGDHSADNQRIWQWVQSDTATASWLNGGTDPNNALTADPDYVSLNLGKAPATDQFDEAYTGKLTCGQVVTNLDSCGGPIDLKNPTSTSCVLPTGDTANPNSKACDVLNTEDMLPVENNFDQAAALVLAASDSGQTRVWDTTAKAPDGTSGWFGSVGSELPGQTFMWTVNDMPDLAAYGLLSAALCPAGTTSSNISSNCIQPSTGNVTAALNSATPDSAGLLQVNPATVPSGAYPLVDVVYAAVPTNQSATALAAYANFISYAAGQGQTTGTAPGDLPPGYLPLPASLQAQAQSVVTQLQTLASATGTPTASPTASTATTPSTGNTQQQTTTSGSTPASGGSTTTGGNTTTSGGNTTPAEGSTSAGGGGSTTASRGSTTPATRSAATSTCTPSASSSPSATSNRTASPSRAAAATAASTTTACASSSPTPQAFDVLPASAQAAAGTTQATAVGTVRNVLIIVLSIGAAGALGGGLLRYGYVPGRGRSGGSPRYGFVTRRGRRSRERPDGR